MSSKKPVLKYEDENGKFDLMAKDWDYLIVLDACRYDFFKEIYRDYLPEGDFRKVKTPAVNTVEWAIKVFRKYYDDVVYVSANPHINSKMEVHGFNASEHFSNIIDVCIWGWDEELDTVHPETVYKSVIRAMEKYIDRRLIIHFEQPHAPYISSEGSQQSENVSGGGFKNIFRRFFSSFIDLLGEENLSKIRKALNLRPLGPQFLGRSPRWLVRKLLFGSPRGGHRRGLVRFMQEESDDVLRQAYEGNLRIVLKYVSKLIEEMDGKIVITADHGEMLGENGQYAHGVDNDLVRYVPWLEIGSGTEEYSQINSKRKIQNKIARLKKEGSI